MPVRCKPKELILRGNQTVCPDAMNVVYDSVCKDCGNQKGFGNTPYDKGKESFRTVKCAVYNRLNKPKRADYNARYAKFLDTKDAECAARKEKETEGIEKRHTGSRHPWHNPDSPDD